MGAQSQPQPQQQAYQGFQAQQSGQPDSSPQNQLSALAASYKGGQAQPGAMASSYNGMGQMAGMGGLQQPRYNPRKDVLRQTMPSQPGIPVLPEPPRANPITLNSGQQQQAQIMPQSQGPQIMPLENSYGRPSKMDRRSMLNRQFNSGGM